MKRIQKIQEMINIWNEISGYRYSFEVINDRLIIRNEVTVEAITKLYGMLQMIQNVVTYVKIDKEEYEVELEVLEI